MPELPSTKAASQPLVSVGLPVYNGQKYLAVAIESVLAQTFADFELVISDNGSTDETQAICEAYAARDARIRYIRQPQNRGAGFNYNFVFHEARGRYFKWLAHDDWLAPDNLKASVAALDADPDVVLAYTHHIDIDDEGAEIRAVRRAKGQDDEVSKRLWDLMEGGYTCEEVFGLIRSSILRKTPLIANHTDSDRTLLGELVLYGKLAEVREPLFYHRIHAGSSVRQNPVFHQRAAWFDPKLKGRLVLSAWRQFFQMLRAIFAAPLGVRTRAACYWQALRWFKWRWRWMFEQLFGEVWHYVRFNLKRLGAGRAAS